MNFGLFEKSLDMIINAIKACPNLEKAAIFGSRSMGNYKNGSDVDLVIFGVNISREAVNRLSVLLNEELPLPYYFDVLHYESLTNDSMKQHIDQYVKTIFHRNT